MIIVLATTRSWHAKRISTHTAAHTLWCSAVRVWWICARILVGAGRGGLHARSLRGGSAHNHGRGIWCWVLRTLQDQKRSRIWENAVMNDVNIFAFSNNNLKHFLLFTFTHAHLAAVVEGAHVARVHFRIVGATIWRIIRLAIRIR